MHLNTNGLNSETAHVVHNWSVMGQKKTSAIILSFLVKVQIFFQRALDCEEMLTFDVERCCGWAAACRVAGRAAVLALVSRSGVQNCQHWAIRTDLNIGYKGKRQNSVTLHRWRDIVLVTCYYWWPGRGWLLARFHLTPAGCAPLPTLHRKLTDSPWRTVAVRGSTETTGAWPATAKTEGDQVMTHHTDK